MDSGNLTERAMKRQEVILKAIAGDMNWIQAARIAGISDRQMRRLKWRYERHGFPCLMDNRHGRPAWNHLPVELTKKVLNLYRDQYFDFNVRHFHEKLMAEHQFKHSYSWLKGVLQEAGLVERKKKKGKHRKKRERRPLVGMLLHLDGSTHRWLGESFPKWDLLAILDDANSEIYDAFFVAEEDTRSVLRIVRSVVDKEGVFCSLYTDRASHFTWTPKAGEKPDKRIRTQCQRALDQLGIELILAFSPQARGRGERMWGTIQGRLPQELRLAGIATLEQANKYLKEIFIPDINKRFMVESKEKGSAFLAAPIGTNLDRIFSLNYKRQVGNDNTVLFKKLALQIPESPLRHHFVKCTVNVYEHLDASISIAYGPHTLGHYSAKGELLKEQQPVQRWLRTDSPGLPERAQGVRPPSLCLPDEPAILLKTAMVLARDVGKNLSQVPVTI